MILGCERVSSHYGAEFALKQRANRIIETLTGGDAEDAPAESETAREDAEYDQLPEISTTWQREEQQPAGDRGDPNARFLGQQKRREGNAARAGEVNQRQRPRRRRPAGQLPDEHGDAPSEQGERPWFSMSRGQTSAGERRAVRRRESTFKTRRAYASTLASIDALHAVVPVSITRHAARDPPPATRL